MRTSIHDLLPHMSMRARVFTTMLLLVLLIELISGLMLYRYLTWSIYENSVDQDARSCQTLASQLIDSSASSSFEGGLNDLLEKRDRWLKRSSRTLESRISLIDLKGSLIFDSEPSLTQLSDSSSYLDRKEIKLLSSNRFGVSRRSVSDQSADFSFIACKIFDPSQAHIGYLRLAKSTDLLDQQLDNLSRVILYILSITFVCALLISAWVARMLSQTLDRLVVLARALAAGEVRDELHFEGKHGPDEYSKLARSLNMLATKIEDQVSRLAESRDRFEAVLDSMREGVIALDAESRVSLANKSACKLLGWTNTPLDHQIDECVSEDSLIHFLRNQVAADSPWVELEFNSKLIVLARLTPQSNRGEAVLVLNDITALRRLETVRRDFVANVSHELRTPTTVIQANAETLLDGAMEDPQLARIFLEGIDRNAQRLAHLVSDLLDLSRIESGTYQMKPERVRPYQIVKSVVDTLAEQLISKHVKVKIELKEDLEIFQDIGALEQIFTNLIENAVKYSHQRGCVTIRAIEQSPHLLRYEVIDDGPGIPQKHHSRIFERFYRVDKGRSRQLGGTGLGLAIVKHLCHEMGGELGLESTEGLGCTFWFSLPRTLIQK